MITCKIFSVKENNTYKNVSSATIDWANREIEILPGHAELFATVNSGKLIIKRDGEENEIVLTGAVINFENPTNTLIVLQ